MNRFATSLEMSGFNVTILLLEHYDIHWLGEQSIIDILVKFNFD